MEMANFRPFVACSSPREDALGFADYVFGDSRLGTVVAPPNPALRDLGQHPQLTFIEPSRRYPRIFSPPQGIHSMMYHPQTRKENISDQVCSLPLISIAYNPICTTSNKVMAGHSRLMSSCPDLQTCASQVITSPFLTPLSATPGHHPGKFQAGNPGRSLVRWQANSADDHPKLLADSRKLALQNSFVNSCPSLVASTVLPFSNATSSSGESTCSPGIYESRPPTCPGAEPEAPWQSPIPWLSPIPASPGPLAIKHTNKKIHWQRCFSPVPVFDDNNFYSSNVSPLNTPQDRNRWFNPAQSKISTVTADRPASPKQQNIGEILPESDKFHILQTPALSVKLKCIKSDNLPKYTKRNRDVYMQGEYLMSDCSSSGCFSAELASKTRSNFRVPMQGHDMVGQENVVVTTSPGGLQEEYVHNDHRPNKANKELLGSGHDWVVGSVPPGNAQMASCPPYSQTESMTTVNPPQMASCPPYSQTESMTTVNPPQLSFTVLPHTWESSLCDKYSDISDAEPPQDQNISGHVIHYPSHMQDAHKELEEKIFVETKKKKKQKYQTKINPSNHKEKSSQSKSRTMTKKLPRQISIKPFCCILGDRTIKGNMNQPLRSITNHLPRYKASHFNPDRTLDLICKRRPSQHHSSLSDCSLDKTPKQQGCRRSESSLDQTSTAESFEDQASPPGSGRKRKCHAPYRSPGVWEPGFYGVTIQMRTKVHSTKSQLSIKAYFSCRKSCRRHGYKGKGSISTLCNRVDTSSSESESLEPPKERRPRTSNFAKQCASCGTKKTPLWRDADDGTSLCNACGIRYKKYRIRCSSCWHIPRKDTKMNPRCTRCGEMLKLAILRNKNWP